MGDSIRKKVMFVLPNHRWATVDENYTMWLIHPTQLCLLGAQIEDKYDVKIIDCVIDDLSEEDFLEIIKKEGGRTTQKDIRKEIPLSEAKTSLMIAELEHKGIIEKIKKGRGNIIILKK